MAVTPDSVPLADDLQPPMANGEVVFEEPWQGRVFGMAVALVEAGHFEWDVLQQSLIEVIEEWTNATKDVAADDGEYPYYDLFQRALMRVLDDTGVVGSDVVEGLASEYAARPHGHDH